MIKDWSKIYLKYKGLWVALKSDQVTVVGSGKTAAKALEQAIKKGYKKPILNFIPQNVVTFVG